MGAGGDHSMEAGTPGQATRRGRYSARSSSGKFLPQREEHDEIACMVNHRWDVGTELHTVLHPPVGL